VDKTTIVNAKLFNATGESVKVTAIYTITDAKGVEKQ
jgi:hypothetical protein